jgi:peptidoglycan-associated lipoprotein
MRDPRAIGHTSSGQEGRMQDVYFAFDSWSISDEGVRYLEEDAQWLYANPGKSLTIEGHCDQRGTQDYNLVLGKKRAEAAREYLINLGVQAYRVKIVSYGKERPFCHDSNAKCFQENRRNHMVIRMNQS